MRNKIVVVLLLGMFFVFLLACTSNNSANIEETKEKSIALYQSFSKPDDYKMPDKDGYQSFVSESQEIFMELIQENPIDQDYRAEKVDGTTLGYRRRAEKYFYIWSEELSYSCECFLEVLNEEEQEVFLHLQNEWNANLSDEMVFVRSLFSSDERQGVVGSLFWYERDSYCVEQVRNRTLYIKYLLYLHTGRVSFLNKQE